MANLMTRWDPFREMVTLRDAMDQIFENALVGFGPREGQTQGQTWGLALDVAENDDNYIIKASVPGVNPDDLDITVQDNVVTIKGEVKAEREDKNERWFVRERRWGGFSRSMALPGSIMADQVQAEYENGVLTLTLPKTEEVRPKRIAIKGGSQKMIEGQASHVEGRSGSHTEQS